MNKNSRNSETKYLSSANNSKIKGNAIFRTEKRNSRLRRVTNHVFIDMGKNKKAEIKHQKKSTGKI